MKIPDSWKNDSTHKAKPIEHYEPNWRIVLMGTLFRLNITLVDTLNTNSID